MLSRGRQLTANDSGLIYIIGYIVMFIVQLVLMLIIGLKGDIEGNGLWLIMVANQVVFIFVTFSYMSMKGAINTINLGFKNKLSRQQYLMLVVIVVVAFIASSPIALFFSRLMGLLNYSNEVTIPTIDSVGMLILGVFILAVLPSIGEEYMFRNGILSGLKRRGYLFAAIVSALLFALIHGNVQQFLHQFYMGMVLAIVMQITNNLIAPMLVHMLNNLLALALGFLIPEKFILENNPIRDIVMVIMVIVGFVLLVMAFIYFARLEKKKRAIIDASDVGKIKFSTTFHNILRYIVSKRSRIQSRESYNKMMRLFDYNKLPEEEGTAVKEDMIYIQFAFAGALVILFLSFLASMFL